MIRRAPWLTLAVLIGACGKSSDPPVAEKESTPPASTSTPPTSTSTSTREVAPRFAWSVFPKRLSYTVHYRGGSKHDLPTVETAQRRDMGDGEIITVNFEQTDADGATTRSVSTHILNQAGMYTTSEIDSFPGKDPEERRYDPPRLDVPAKVVPGAEWTVPRYDGTTKQMTTVPSSPFCADGFRVVTQATPKIGGRQRMTHHWCPGTGWRGQDSFTVLEHGNKVWMWTTGLVADGKALPDSAVGERFPEAAPPE